MGRRRVLDMVEEIRFAPNTMVLWFEGTKERSGWVLLNIRRGRGLAPHVVIRDAQGAKHIVSGDRVFVKAQGGQS